MQVFGFQGAAFASCFDHVWKGSQSASGCGVQHFRTIQGSNLCEIPVFEAQGSRVRGAPGFGFRGFGLRIWGCLSPGFVGGLCTAAYFRCSLHREVVASIEDGRKEGEQ